MYGASCGLPISAGSRGISAVSGGFNVAVLDVVFADDSVSFDVASVDTVSVDTVSIDTLSTDSVSVDSMHPDISVAAQIAQIITILIALFMFVFSYN
jgi:hypothetical protein